MGTDSSHGHMRHKKHIRTQADLQEETEATESLKMNLRSLCYLL